MPRFPIASYDAIPSFRVSDCWRRGIGTVPQSRSALPREPSSSKGPGSHRRARERVVAPPRSRRRRTWAATQDLHHGTGRDA